MVEVGRLLSHAEYNSTIDSHEASYRLSIKKELRKKGIVFNSMETTESLEYKRDNYE